MIGVIANSSDQAVVREFFELFKTPWEFHQSNRRYEVLLCCGEGAPCNNNAKLVLIYAAQSLQFDTEHGIEAVSKYSRNRFLSYKGTRIPLYCDCTTFRQKTRNPILLEEESHNSALHIDWSDREKLVRIGYDLFGEIRSLLTVGQPAANAGIPTLELHIAFLRDLITWCGVPLVEIPPVPYGYRFVSCLTHDIDHPSIRQHKWDHTIFGFLYRAVFGSLVNSIRGRMSVQGLGKNWAAALKLPFVYAGLAKDFWRDFDDRYLELEKGLPSTFFVIPFRNCSGKSPHGPAPAFRASRYRARDIAETIRKLMNAGCEVGLHGIDAWLDSTRGREELEEIRHLTGASEIGVRMHWLYSNGQSPSALERAGAAYDSTIGYNETVGYRAGTTQVYKPLDTSRLVELPLHVMDTAVFYPNNLGLTPRQARVLFDQMVDNVIHFGGTLTVNWHDRSIAPERLWDASYRDLVQSLKSRGAWFSTARQAISWFAKRRMAVFEIDATDSGAVRAWGSPNQCANLPGLRLRIHKARKLGPIGAHHSEDYVDIAVDESMETSVPSKAGK